MSTFGAGANHLISIQPDELKFQCIIPSLLIFAYHFFSFFFINFVAFACV
jgi:hypothetical protein